MKYILGGDPIALARARHSNSHFYDTQKKLKQDASIQIEAQRTEKTILQGIICFEVDFFFPIPKSSIKRTAHLLDRPHIYKPDLSNLIKFIEDVGTGLLYKDDCQIAWINARKMYSLQPRTEFQVYELKPGKFDLDDPGHSECCQGYLATNGFIYDKVL